MRKMCFLAIFAVFSLASMAQTPSSTTPVLPGFPANPHWRNNPADWSLKDGNLTIKSAEKTDWYIAPTNGGDSKNSPILLFPGPKDFWFSAKVTVDFKSSFDAGVLAIYANDKTWIKFALEQSNEGKPSIVTVVTRGLSDDCTGTAIEGNSVYLKAVKAGQAIFLYFSADGKHWSLTRVLNLGTEQNLQFGFSSQSPTGGGSTATFSDIHYKAERLRDWSGD
jgi:regulation of enolase protein 1 (concanavalin A-like superfamily)